MAELIMRGKLTFCSEFKTHFHLLHESHVFYYQNQHYLSTTERANVIKQPLTWNKWCLDSFNLEHPKLSVPCHLLKVPAAVCSALTATGHTREIRFPPPYGEAFVWFSPGQKLGNINCLRRWTLFALQFKFEMPLS